MKVTFTLLFALLAIMASILFWPTAKKFIQKDSCLDSGGRWATNGDFCIRNHCIEDESCKPSYRNSFICENLKTGITQNELYFHLGMPESQTGNVFTFAGSALEPHIEAIISDGVVRELKCKI